MMWNSNLLCTRAGARADAMIALWRQCQLRRAGADGVPGPSAVLPAQCSRCRPQGRVTCHVSGVLGRLLGMVLRDLGQVGLNALLLTLAESHEVIVPKPNLCKLTSSCLCTLPYRVALRPGTFLR